MCSPEVAIPNESTLRVKGHGVCACVLERIFLTYPFQKICATLLSNKAKLRRCRQDKDTSVSDSVATVLCPYLLEEQSFIEAFNGRERVGYLQHECTRKEL